MSSNIDFGGLCFGSFVCRTFVLPPNKASLIRFTALSISDNFLGLPFLACSFMGVNNHVSDVLPLVWQVSHFHLRMVVLLVSSHRVSRHFILCLHVGHLIVDTKPFAQVETVCCTYLIYLINYFFNGCC